MLMQIAEKVVRKVRRACNRWLVDRYLQKTGLTVEEIIKRSTPPPPPLTFPRGLAADKAFGTVTDETPLGRWVGPCVAGEASKITFGSSGRGRFKSKRLLVNAVRTGKPTALVVGRIFVGDTRASIGKGTFDLEAAGHPEGLNKEFVLEVSPYESLEIEAHLEGEPLKAGESIAITVQLLGEWTDEKDTVVQAN